MPDLKVRRVTVSSAAAPIATLGIDFGTTNTVMALSLPGQEAQVVTLQGPAGGLSSFRSALGFQIIPAADGSAPERLISAGPWAVETYLEDPLETRFIQSFKNFAASAAFSETVIDGRRYRFEDLLAVFMEQVRHHAGEGLANLPPRVIVGRPVTFAGGNPNEPLALERYQAAFTQLGFGDIRYAYEPVGAAFYFARSLKETATVLVADFGGGTSDFSIIRFEPTPDGLRSTPLGRAGVGIAGDAFDYRIIDNLVSPELGKGTTYTAMGKTLPVPQRYFTAFAKWEQLALLRASRDMKDIRGLVRNADEPEKMERLVEVLDENYGYALYQSVSALKIALSSQDEAEFVFAQGDVDIRHTVSRDTFEGWIAPELTQIEGAVDLALERAGMAPEGIDRVFLTGGTSFVPAVRRMFVDRFSEERIESGSEFESIASGLALIGQETDLDMWSEAQNAA
ncbi:Hsp70 family protein [Brevundimonas sp.]|uniref:Hsp70 family protein n=1 Tax=Brevundimonas sp. TaxID=1871086 RepID=UPI0028A1FB50|nr:Hsp70 family protein [Brevundimonas sp.]